MTDAAVLDYKMQVSIKHGPGQSCMTNVRARDADELEYLLSGLVGKGPDIAAACEALGVVQTIAQAMPGTTVVNSPGQSGDSSPRTCGHQENGGWVSHGAMKYIEKPDYAGHFCPLAKDNPRRCKP